MRRRTNSLFERETVAGGVQDPRIIVGAFHTGMQPKGLSWQFSSCSGAGVGQRTVGLSLHITLFLPFGKISQGSQLCWILHPLDNLKLFFLSSYPELNLFLCLDMLLSSEEEPQLLLQSLKMSPSIRLVVM